MACPRCGGLLVPNSEVGTGIYEEKTWVALQGYRCINCGFIDDPVIRANRMSCIIAGLADWQPHVRSKGLSTWHPNGWRRTGAE